MRAPILLLCFWSAAVAGCGNKGPDTFAEAEALAQQGKLEEAAAKVDATCAFAPDGDPCRASDRRAAEIRIKAAEKAMADGRFERAEQILTLALATADAPTAEVATQRLASEDLKQGLAYERAIGGADGPAVLKAMEAIAATKTPAAALAKAWMDRERPAILVAAVKAACGAAHEGSCSTAAAALRAAAIPGPEAEAAIASAEEEERRVYPRRVDAETFLKGFADAEERDKATEMCRQPLAVTGDWAFEACAKWGMTPGYTLTAAEQDDRREKRKIRQAVWRKAMRAIADPGLVLALEERRTKAEAIGEFKKNDVPKPPKAPAGVRK